MNSAKIKKSYNWVLLLDEQNLRRLYSEIFDKLKGEGEPKINISIDYLDGSSFRTQNIEELINDENLISRKIKRVLFEGSTENKKISLLFGGKENNHFLEIEGPDRQWIYVTKSIIEDRLKDCRDRKLRTGTIWFFVTSIIVLLTILIAPHFGKYLPPITVVSQGRNTTGLGFWIWAIVDVILAIILGISIGYLYPNLTFLIGKEIIRYEKKSKIKSNLFWAGAVALAASLLGSLMIKVFL